MNAAMRESDGRKRGARAVSDMVPAAARAAFRKFGFVESSIISRWSDIVGEAYAKHSAPDSLKFPMGKRSGGTLTVVCAGPFAVTLQHVEPQIIERVNRFFGYAAVERIALRQGELPKRAKPQAAAEDMPLTAETVSSLKAIGDPSLRAALEGLARQIPVTRGVPVIE